MGCDEIFKEKKRQKKKRKEDALKMVPYRYLIVCEGEKTEPNYFEGIRRKISAKYKDNIVVKEQIELNIQGTGRNTTSLIEYTEFIINRSQMPYGHIWVIFDKDSFSDDQFI